MKYKNKNNIAYIKIIKLLKMSMFTDIMFAPYKYIIEIMDCIYIPILNDYIYNDNDNYNDNIINDTFDKININNSLHNSLHNSLSENYIYNYISLDYIINLIILVSIYITSILIKYSIAQDINKFNKINKFNDINEINKFNEYENAIKQFGKNITNITSGMFLDSIKELNRNNKYIINKMINTRNNETNATSTIYYALIKVKMNKSINMALTKYKIPNNNINEINIDKKTFNTNNMYMIIKFIYSNDINDINKCKMYNFIINILNLLNSYSSDEFKNKDFIVLAISKENYVNPNEFYESLININYNLFNIKHINLTNDKKLGFILLLPIKKIYDLFLDVYNDVIFESTTYKINSNNNEYWNDNLLE